MNMIKFILITLSVLLGLFILKAIFIAIGLFFMFLKLLAIAIMIATCIFIGYNFKHKNR